MDGKELRKQLWLEKLDTWRNRYGLSRRQAISIFLENDGNGLKSLYWESGEHIDFAIESLKEIESKEFREPIEDTINDGFGNVWSAWCHNCKQKTMEIVRPGKVQCSECG